jgi:hypothetical protein
MPKYLMLFKSAANSVAAFIRRKAMDPRKHWLIAAVSVSTFGLAMAARAETVKWDVQASFGICVQGTRQAIVDVRMLPFL